MFHNYTEEELRSICRTSIESLEIWARRLIHEQMCGTYGENYMEYKINNREFLIKKEVRLHVQSKLSEHPDRFARPVDTLFLSQLAYFLCHPTLYPKLFKPALDYIYPQGRDEANEFLSRLVPIRNFLSHSNSISVHQAEQAICYSHDFIEGLKQYYKGKGLEQVWNVPRIIRIIDSLGNVFNNPTDSHCQNSIFTISQELYCGDTYSVDIEVDTSFPQSDFDIFWSCGPKEMKEFNNMTHWFKVLSEVDVGELLIVRCQIVSHEKWHRYTYYDCEVNLHLQVLPPVSIIK